MSLLLHEGVPHGLLSVKLRVCSQSRSKTEGEKLDLKALKKDTNRVNICINKEFLS